MKTISKTLIPIVVVSGALMPSASHADGVDEPIPSYYQEPGQSKNREYVNQHPVERVDPFTGKLQLHYVDLFVPGNGGLDIKVQRSYTSPNDMPPGVPPTEESPFGIGWTVNFGRIIRNATTPICDTTSPPTKNPVLELPDGGRQILYVAMDGRTFISTGRWKAECAADRNSLTVYSPDGIRYEMSTLGPLVGNPLVAQQQSYYVSSMVDRNGNSLTFSYTWPSTRTMGVSAITASDGRIVTFQYQGGVLKEIVEGTRHWSYAYQPAAGLLGNYAQLTTVSRPDGAAWNYEYNDASSPGGYAMRRIGYPTGGWASYTYGSVAFTPNPVIPPSTVVTRKTASDPVEDFTWTYEYRPATEPYQPEKPFTIGLTISNPFFDRTTVTGPDGVHAYFHVGYGSASVGTVYAIGLLAGVAHGSTQVDIYGWWPQQISNQSNERPGGILAFDVYAAAPLMTAKVIYRNGANHVTRYGDFDEFGNPATIVETGTADRTTTVTYNVNTTKWILHQKKDETIDNIAGITRTFDDNGNLTSETRFKVPSSYTYFSSGDVATRTDARGNVTSFGTYRRGIPLSETRPEGVSISRSVSDAGNIVSETDGENRTTTYEYDALNRLTAIRRPLGNSVVIAWTPNSRTVTRGSYHEVTTLDIFGRELQVTHRDLARDETVYQTYRYDSVGRRVFASYPNSTSGTTTSYDIIGQTVRVEHADGTSRSYSYAGNQTLLTNERGLGFTYFHRAYGDPDQKQLMAVDTPEPGTGVAISRNLLGQVTAVSQGGLTRRFTYDDRYHLVSQEDPEVGQTAFGRDALGNMTSRQVGTSAVTRYGYDGLNRLTTITYPAGTPSVTRTYYRDDKLKSIDNGVAARAYAYDANKNLVAETLAVGSAAFATGYEYNANDALSAVVYGSGKSVQYAPDAFGRPTQAMPYVISVSHHPTGAISGMTFANGVRTTVGLNTRRWPSQLLIEAGAKLFDLSYGYDGTANVTAITDALDAGYGRSMTYDGVDRLSTISGPWPGNSNGRITYDGSGNVVSQTLGTSGLAYGYDPVTNRLLAVSGWKNAAYAYDGYGNVVGDGTTAFAYDDAQTMRCAKCGQADEVLYDYDGAGMRVRMQKGGQATYFVQDNHGNLLWEQTPGVGLKEYVYLAGKQVAVRQQAETAP